MHAALIQLVVIGATVIPLAFYLVLAFTALSQSLDEPEWLGIVWSTSICIGAGTGYMALDALRTGTSASRKFLYSAGIVVGMLSTVPAIEIFHPAKSFPIAYVIYGPIFGGSFLLVFLLRESWVRR